jgi:hypothetical protein
MPKNENETYKYHSIKQTHLFPKRQNISSNQNHYGKQKRLMTKKNLKKDNPDTKIGKT